MNEPGTERKEFSGLSREETHSVLFAQMIMQLSNMAMMLLGKVPDPQSGQIHRDLEAAKLFIDQLEALEAKTKGNLTKEEDALLKQALMTLRLSFVEAVESPKPAGKTAEASTTPAAPQPPPAASENKTAPPQSADAATEESAGKRFSKKYSS
jgi:Domain of unknown function (DUF1844)